MLILEPPEPSSTSARAAASSVSQATSAEAEGSSEVSKGDSDDESSVQAQRHSGKTNRFQELNEMEGLSNIKTPNTTSDDHPSTFVQQHAEKGESAQEMNSNEGGANDVVTNNELHGPDTGAHQSSLSTKGVQQAVELDDPDVRSHVYPFMYLSSGFAIRY